jgi:hypothetical protein
MPHYWARGDTDCEKDGSSNVERAQAVVRGPALKMASSRIEERKGSAFVEDPFVSEGDSYEIVEDFQLFSLFAAATRAPPYLLQPCSRVPARLSLSYAGGALQLS